MNNIYRNRKTYVALLVVVILARLLCFSSLAETTCQNDICEKMYFSIMSQEPESLVFIENDKEKTDKLLLLLSSLVFAFLLFSLLTIIKWHRLVVIDCDFSLITSLNSIYFNVGRYK